jgi:hypothetical protein
LISAPGARLATGTGDWDERLGLTTPTDDSD